MNFDMSEKRRRTEETSSDRSSHAKMSRKRGPTKESFQDHASSFAEVVRANPVIYIPGDEESSVFDLDNSNVEPDRSDPEVSHLALQLLSESVDQNEDKCPNQSTLSTDNFYDDIDCNEFLKAAVSCDESYESGKSSTSERQSVSSDDEDQGKYHNQSIHSTDNFHDSMSINECLKHDTVSCDESSSNSETGLSPTSAEGDRSPQDMMNFSIHKTLSYSSVSIDAAKSFTSCHGDEKLANNSQYAEMCVNECIELAMDNQDSNFMTSPLKVGDRESEQDLKDHDLKVLLQHENSINEEELKSMAPLAPAKKQIKILSGTKRKLFHNEEGKIESSQYSFSQYCHSEATGMDEPVSGDGKISSGPFARKACNSGPSGPVDWTNVSTPLKDSTLSEDTCSLSSMNFESDLSSVLSLDEDGDAESMNDMPVKQFSYEEIPLIPSDILEDPEDTVLLDESIGDILEVEGNTALTRSCLLNNIKLYEDSESSVNEAILKVMRLFVKNKESKSGLQRIITTMSSLLPQDHKMPSTAYHILQYVESLAPPVPAVLHYYCKQCQFYYGTEIITDKCCQICSIKTEFGQFYIYDIGALLKFFFENRNLAGIIDLETKKDSENCDFKGVRCIKDGSVYKLLNANRGKYDISIIFGSDGVRIRKGSAKELWLALFTIAELPTHLQRSFLSVAGVWYDEKKPDMKTFLKPFSETMQRLDKDQGIGCEWTHPSTKEVIKSHVNLLVTVLDAPARAIVQNVLQFNGRYGCNICEIKAQLSEPVPSQPDLKAIRVYYYVAKPKLRTKERMFKQAERVLAEGKRDVRGVKGPSVLSLIPSVDISKCKVPEYLHSVLLGVTKQQLTIWLENKGPFSLVQKVKEIDDFLRKFKHPDFVHRPQRQLRKLKYWKASDLYYFLLFESLLSLADNLPDVYLQHFMLLVKGIFTLLKTSISESEIEQADKLLQLYASDFKVLYGSRELTHNVHQLIHLALCVRRYGPLHCFSAFPFEDLNGLIAHTTHGTNQVDVEIVQNIRICQGINILQNVVEGCDGLDVCNRYSEGEFLGRPVNIPTPNELLCFLTGDKAPKIYSRAKLGYDTFTSEVYKALSSENFNVMWTVDNSVKYGSIKYFAETETDRYVVLKLWTVKNTELIYHQETLTTIEHIVPVEASNIYITTFKDIVPSIVKVGKKGSYIYKRPNLFRFVM